MPLNEGFYCEDEFVYRLHNKKIKELTPNLKTFAHALFGILDDEEVITCVKTEDYIKPDFIVTYKGVERYVSMKSGRCEIVHQETIRSFILFLRSLGISTRTQQTILLFHYGDGTMDGTGKRRYKYEELKLKLQSRINEANAELNSNQDIIDKIVEHCLFIGTKPGALIADSLYHGNAEYGNLATKKQIMKHIYRKDWSYITTPHVGPLQFRPHSRYIDKPIKSLKKREAVEGYWSHLGADIDYISHRYDY